jgi:hypothetical protein
MKRVLVVLFATSCFCCSNVRADEGMWLLPLLEKINQAEMTELGFQLTAEDIYNVNHSGLKDAIVFFGGGCTGGIVSDDGLLFTNHHCGYDEIQNHSSIEHDYLKDGFWAMDREEELPNPGLEVRFLRSIENVTAEITNEIPDSTDEETRRKLLKEKALEIESKASDDGKYRADVKSFFAGNEYYLFVYEVFKDVRFVGAPPSAIGKFGYDTDNWEWPRHTGDFSIFRIYTAPDGSPAEYDAGNIPLRSKRSLPVSMNGVNEGDFTFILGYPGSTDRYLSSFGIKQTMEVTNDIRIAVRGVRQEILQNDMVNDQAVNIKYASKYSRSSNYWKYSIGQNRGLKRLNVIPKKEVEEAEFQIWAEADSARKAQYGSLLEELETVYVARNSSEFNFQYLNEAFFRAAEIMDFISEFQYLYMLLLMEDQDNEDLTNEISELREMTETFFAEYNQSTDQKVTEAMFRLYGGMVPLSQRPDVYDLIQKKYKGDYHKFVSKLFDNTFFLSGEKVKAFLDEPEIATLNKDMGFITMNSIFRKYYEEYQILDSYDLELNGLNRKYLQARMEKDSNALKYPDANLTMRLTYGTVGDYSPRDAVHYDYITFLKGVMEKEDPENFEFVVPGKLKELYEKKDYGPYSKDDKMPVCFITNNDITGGNSGSPVLNAKGELIGLAFDGNWEAMSGDIAYEPELQRCICVDIRYILFIIDKYAGAGHLVKELKLIN